MELQEERERREQELKTLFNTRNEEIKEMYSQVNVLFEEDTVKVNNSCIVL